MIFDGILIDILCTCNEFKVLLLTLYRRCLGDYDRDGAKDGKVTWSESSILVYNESKYVKFSLISKF